MNIEWQPYNNGIWQTVAVGVPNTGSYEWNVPRQPGDQARIRISNSGNPAQADTSDATFNVTYTYSWRLSAQLACANGAQPTRNATSAQFVYALWPPNPLVWNVASAGQVLTVQSSASVNNGYLALQTIDDYYEYLVPLKNQEHPALEAGTFFNPLTPMIRWATAKLPEGSYTVPFYAPTRWCPGSAPFQFVSPSANQALRAGYAYSVTWVGGNDVAQSVKIEFSKDNGKTWYTLTNSTPNRNNYTWYVSYDLTTQGRLRISSTSDPKISAISPPFSIVLQ